MVARILHRYNESKAWTMLNPTLGKGEMGIESNTGLVKIGDGKTPWRELDYYTGEGQRYFYANLARAPKNLEDFWLRGTMVYTFSGPPHRQTERAFMYLHKITDKEDTIKLIPISYFANIRSQLKTREEGTDEGNKSQVLAEI